MRGLLAVLLLVGCSSTTEPTTADASGCATAKPSTMCVYCNGDVATAMECRDGKWQCPAGASEKCTPGCSGEGPICCGRGASTTATCTGVSTWQCPIGTIAQPKSMPCPTTDAGVDSGTDTSDSGGTCASSATTEGCIACCRQSEPPNYGGFELYAYDACTACPSCKDLSPCGTNVTPAAGKTCVGCLQMKLASGGLPSMCASNAKCKAFADCMTTCPLK